MAQIRAHQLSQQDVFCLPSDYEYPLILGKPYGSDMLGANFAEQKEEGQWVAKSEEPDIGLWLNQPVEILDSIT